MAEIKSRRIVRNIPAKTIEPVPAGTILTYGQLDYIDEGKDAAPEDAVYVATMDVEGKIEVALDTFPPPERIGKVDEKGNPVLDSEGKPVTEPKEGTAAHTFAGWPIPGEVIVEEIAVEKVKVVK